MSARRSNPGAGETDVARLFWREPARTSRSLPELSGSEIDDAQFRLLADNIPTLCWLARADGYIIWYNRRWHDYCGTTPAAMEGWGWQKVHDPAELPRVMEAWTVSIATGEPFEMVFPLRGADGVFRPFLTRIAPLRDTSGRLLSWFGTNAEIGAQVRAETALRAVQEELELANATLAQQVDERTRERDQFWSLSEDLLITADASGRLRSVSPSWTRLLGLSEAELVGRAYADFIHPDDLDAGAKIVAAVQADGNPLRFETRVRDAEENWRWVSWTFSADPRGERLIGVGRDITADRERAEALARTQEALRQSQKMEAVGQLTGGIAHDFNNLLTGIIGSLELMTTRIAQGRSGDIERYSTAAQGAARRAAALTHRLLAFSRRQTLDPKPTDANRLIAGMEDLVRRTVGPAATIEVVAAAGLWPTLVDPGQLENALLNLCINARDAMPEGGRITIETANRWMDKRAAAERDLAPGQYISMCVSDTGSGMSADVIAKAFEPFFTTKPLGAGTGLGLSMVYGFARQSGGQVRIYSETGGGAMVCLYLPRHRGEAETVEALPDLGAAPRATHGETVLVVDDEPTVRMLVTEVLEELGYAAIEAADGPSGLKLLQSDMRVDLLVTDVGLPGGMNGRQMADAGRVGRPGLKVLFITGYAENAVVGNGHLAPGMHVMTKPFAMEALAARIKDVIGNG